MKTVIPAQVVETLVDTMVARAADKGATDADVARALVKALATLRETFARQGGYAIMRTFDDTLRTQLIAMGLEHLKRTGAEPPRASDHLPAAAGPAAQRAAAILTDAVGSSLLVNVWGPGNVLLQVAAGRLIRHLVTRLGGAVPRWDTLETWMGASDAPRGAAWLDDGPLPAAGRLQ